MGLSSLIMSLSILVARKGAVACNFINIGYICVDTYMPTFHKALFCQFCET